MGESISPNSETEDTDGVDPTVSRRLSGNGLTRRRLQEPQEPLALFDLPKQSSRQRTT